MNIIITLDYVLLEEKSFTREGKNSNLVKLGFPAYYSNLEFWVNKPELFAKRKKQGKVNLSVDLVTCKTQLIDFI